MSQKKIDLMSWYSLRFEKCPPKEMADGILQSEVKGYYLLTVFLVVLIWTGLVTPGLHCI